MAKQNRSKQRVTDQKTHFHTFRLNEQQELKYRKMLEQSGAPTQAKFILSRIFG